MSSNYQDDGMFSPDAPSTIISGGQFNFARRDIVNHYHYHGKENLVSSILKAIPNFRKIHAATLGRATPGTGTWIYQWETFILWLDVNGILRILWGSGLPGAGKTILASIVINMLEVHARAAVNPVCICHVYFRYSDHAQMTVRGVLETLAKQTVERHPHCFELLEQVYSCHVSEETEPTEQELLSLLHQFTSMVAATFYFLDALDEAPPPIQREIVAKLASLDVRLFITSRPLQAIQAHFPQAYCFPIVAQESDIDIHIYTEVNRSPELCGILQEADPSLGHQLVASVKQKCDGMFLHAALQLDALKECSSLQDVKEILEEFPEAIEQVYLRTWDRILNQTKRQVVLVKRVLLWVLYTIRSLTVEELQQALSTNPDTHVLEPERSVPETTFIGLCRGLVTVEPESRIVRLAHYTAKEPLQRLIMKDCPHPHSIIAAACVTRMFTCGLHNTTIASQVELEAKLQEEPLLNYAHYAWSTHAREALKDGIVTNLIANFVAGCQNFPVLRYNVQWPWFAALGPLHTAAFFDLPVSLVGPVHTLDPNVRTPKWEDTPLHMTCLQGSERTAEELLNLPGIMVDAVTITGRTPLMYAARYGHDGIARLLLANPMIQVNRAHRRFGATAVIRAARFGHLGVVRLLLAHPDTDVNFATLNKATSLIITARHGHTEIAKLFLAHPKTDVNRKGNEGATALMVASRNGFEEIVAALLAHPLIDVNDVDEAGGTALSRAAAKGHIGVLKLLLSHPSIDVNKAGASTGATALIQAAKEGQIHAVKLLLAHPRVNVNLVDRDHGRTAFRWASTQGHIDVVNLLTRYQRRLSG